MGGVVGDKAVYPLRMTNAQDAVIAQPLPHTPTAATAVAHTANTPHSLNVEVTCRAITMAQRMATVMSRVASHGAGRNSELWAERVISTAIGVGASRIISSTWSAFAIPLRLLSPSLRTLTM